jgi:hypothetical protein
MTSSRQEGRWIHALPIDQDIIIGKRSMLKDELLKFVDSFYLEFARPKH